jgi:hypothetical protein
MQPQRPVELFSSEYVDDRSSRLLFSLNLLGLNLRSRVATIGFDQMAWRAAIGDPKQLLWGISLQNAKMRARSRSSGDWSGTSTFEAEPTATKIVIPARFPVWTVISFADLLLRSARAEIAFNQRRGG